MVSALLLSGSMNDTACRILKIPAKAVLQCLVSNDAVRQKIPFLKPVLCAVLYRHNSITAID